MNLAIRPHDGVGPIDFGDSRTVARIKLGSPVASTGDKEAFLGSGFLILHYDGFGLVEFIEVAHEPGVAVTLCGIDVFLEAPPVIVRKLSEHAQLDRGHPEYPDTLEFPALGITMGLAAPFGDRLESVGAGSRAYYSRHGSALPS